MTRIERGVPYVLTLVAAGLGHLYAGYWRRGALWLATYAVAVVFFSGYSPVGLVGGQRPFIVGVLGVELNPVDAMFPLAILVLCLLDVYVRVSLEPADVDVAVDPGRD